MLPVLQKLIANRYAGRDLPVAVVLPDGARMLWILAPGGFEDFIEEVSVPAETPTVPPAHILPPENAAEIVLKHGNELLPG